MRHQGASINVDQFDADDGTIVHKQIEGRPLI
jgi:hypothetical protein